ncbi:MAG: arginine repressor [Calditrichales bacterium]|nr:MAG: arginine repressor [Calditrichales bacterium]
MPHSKHGRQSKIKEIISTSEVSSQEDLCRTLEKSGFETTQATLSRDLHELGIVRIPSENGFKYVFHLEDTENTVKQLIGMEIINVMSNESTVVVRTMPGRAAGVAVYLDRIKDSHIIGTVAGDDSIIIIPDSHKNIHLVVERIKNISQK